MSASEKLKALRATGFTCEHWTDHDASDLDVTDELIAVVEAAERQLHYTDGRAIVRHKPAEKCPLCDALSALEEALTPDFWRPTGRCPEC